MNVAVNQYRKEKRPHIRNGNLSKSLFYIAKFSKYTCKIYNYRLLLVNTLNYFIPDKIIKILQILDSCT